MIRILHNVWNYSHFFFTFFAVFGYAIAIITTANRNSLQAPCSQWMLIAHYRLLPRSKYYSLFLLASISSGYYVYFFSLFLLRSFAILAKFESVRKFFFPMQKMCMCKCFVLFAVWCSTKSSFVLISAKFSIYFHYESFCVLKHFFRLFRNMHRDNFSSEHLFHFCGKIDTFIA